MLLHLVSISIYYIIPLLRLFFPIQSGYTCCLPLKILPSRTEWQKANIITESPSSLPSSHYNRRSPRLFIITLIKGPSERKMAFGQYKRDMTEDPDYTSRTGYYRHAHCQNTERLVTPGLYFIPALILDRIYLRLALRVIYCPRQPAFCHERCCPAGFVQILNTIT